MDDNIEPSNVYITPPTNILDEKKIDDLDGVVNDQQEWGKMELPHKYWT